MENETKSPVLRALGSSLDFGDDEVAKATTVELRVNDAYQYVRKVNVNLNSYSFCLFFV